MVSVTQGWIHSCINQVSSQLLSGQTPSNVANVPYQHTNSQSACQSFVQLAFCFERSFPYHIEIETLPNHEQ